LPAGSQAGAEAPVVAGSRMDRVMWATVDFVRRNWLFCLVLVGGLMLRALAQDRRQSFPVAGLIGIGSGQRGRRIQGQTILGGIDDMPTVLDRLAAEDRLPATIVIASPDLGGPALSRLVDQADRFGLALRRSPRPTALGGTRSP